MVWWESDLMRWQYSSTLPVTLSMMAPMKLTELALTGEFALCITPYVFSRRACMAAMYLCDGKEVVGLRSINGIKALVMAELMRWTWLDWCWAQVRA
jgi:hypothetical protein